jgi:hypothetical protein
MHEASTVMLFLLPFIPFTVLAINAKQPPTGSSAFWPNSTLPTQKRK